MCHINKIYHRFLIIKLSISVGCDEQEGLRTVCDDFLSLRKSQFDYTSSLSYCLKQSPIKWPFRHLKGHQDDHKNYNFLDKQYQLTGDADRLANERLHQVIQEYHQLPANVCLPGKI